MGKLIVVCLASVLIMATLGHFLPVVYQTAFMVRGFAITWFLMATVGVMLVMFKLAAK